MGEDCFIDCMGEDNISKQKIMKYNIAINHRKDNTRWSAKGESSFVRWLWVGSERRILSGKGSARSLNLTATGERSLA